MTSSAAKEGWAREYTWGAICLCVLIGILIAGLWPFSPFPRNGVRWLTSENGLRFGPDGIVVSSTDFQWAGSSGTGPCSLEIWLRPDKNNGSRDILTLHSLENPQRLRLFQWAGSTLLLYKDWGTQHREIDINNVLHPGVSLFITITGGPQHTSVYVNGRLAGTSRRLALSRSDLGGQLILGTSPLADSAWAGDVYGIAVYGTELTATQVTRHFDAWRGGEYPAIEADEMPVALYAFSERQGRVVHNEMGAGPDLTIPERFLIPHKTLLLAPWKDIRWNRNSTEDAVINVAGFVPFGFSVCAYLSLKSKRATALTIAGGATLSLTIEILQVFLPRRTSSLADVMMNVLGVALGILLCKSWVTKHWLAERPNERCPGSLTRKR